MFTKKVLQILLFIAGLLLLLQPVVTAQSVEAADSPGEWVVFHRGNSPLPGNNITALAEDETGIVWVAVDGKIIAFNGLEWKKFRKPGSWTGTGDINCIVIDRFLNKWVGSAKNGLAKLEDSRWIVYSKKNADMPVNSVSSIVIDPKENIWIGTLGGGIIRYNDTSWTIFNKENSELPDDHVNAIAVDEEGAVWIGTKKGLVKFDGDSIWSRYIVKNTGNSINSVAVDANGNKWLGCGAVNSRNSGGVILLNDKNQRQYIATNSKLPSNYVRHIAIEKDKAWVAVSNSEYNNFKADADVMIKGGIAIIKNGSSLTNYTAALERYMQTIEHSFYPETGLETSRSQKQRSHNVNSILIDMHGNKWIATANGLFVYRKNGVILGP